MFFLFFSFRVPPLIITAQFSVALFLLVFFSCAVALEMATLAVAIKFQVIVA